MIQQVKTILTLCLITLAFSVHSSAQQGAKAEMIITRSVESTDPIHQAITAKYGNDEAAVGKAKQKVRELKNTGKRVMTAQGFAEWKQALNTKMNSLKSNADKQKMRQYIDKKIAQIVILEDNI